MFDKKLCATLILFSVLSVYSVFSFVYAGGAGTQGGQFLKIGGDARAMGIGEAFTAISDDVNAVYWNPAGISQNKERQTSLTHMNMLAGTRYFNLAYTQPVTRNSSVGFDLFNLYSIDGIYDDIGNKTGEFTNLNSYLTVAYSHRLTNNLHSGISVKTVYNQLESYRSSNLVIDLSGLYLVTDNLSFGVNLQSIGTGLKFTEDIETSALNLKTGLAYRLLNDTLTMAVDINAAVDSKPIINTGVEYWIFNSPKSHVPSPIPTLRSGQVSEIHNPQSAIRNPKSKILALRGGYRFRTDNPPFGQNIPVTAGLGLKLKSYQIDYAYVPYGLLGNNTHFVSLSAKF